MGGHRVLSFEEVVGNKNLLIDWADLHPVLAPAAFVATYLALGLFGLPGSTLLNFTAGLLFDLPEGLILVVLASTLASSLAYFSFRYLLRGFVQEIARRRLPGLETTLQREGFWFVFAMRLAPVVPFSLTNLVLAVSPVRFGTYFWATLIAMIPRFVLYVHAGTHLGDVQDPEDLFSPSLLGALALLAVLPPVLRLIAQRIKGRRGGSGN